MLVGSADVEAALLQQRGQGRHRRAADANQMHAHYETAAFCDHERRSTEPTAPRGATRPSGSVHVAPTV